MVVLYEPETNPFPYDEFQENEIESSRFSWRALAMQVLKDWVRPFVIMFLVVSVINIFFPRVYVLGHSMDPVLSEQDWLVVSNIDTMIGSIERGEIVTIISPRGEVAAIKRVIGLPGELIEIVDGIVFVDGQPLIEDYITEVPRYSGHWRVGADEYFVLGDNRNHSTDSADYGPIEASRIQGVAKLRLLPFEHAGFFIVPTYDVLAE